MPRCALPGVRPGVGELHFAHETGAVAHVGLERGGPFPTGGAADADRVVVDLLEANLRSPR